MTQPTLDPARLALLLRHYDAGAMTRGRVAECIRLWARGEPFRMPDETWPRIIPTNPGANP